MVLLVDDDPGVRGLLAALVTREGLGYEVARDGNEAIAQLRRKEYDLLILDLMLPERNGFEVLQFLKAERQPMLRRTIVITAATDATLRHFNTDLVHSMIRKPFDIGELTAALREFRTTSPAPMGGETRRWTDPHPSR
jgi:DNA-binding response OmpR family regulator